MLVQLTAAVGILNRGCRCKPWQLTGRSPPIGSPANAYVTTRSWPPPHTTTNRGWYKAGDAPCLTIRSMLGETCQTARHSAGPPSPSSRCLNRDGERASAKMTALPERSVVGDTVQLKTSPAQIPLSSSSLSALRGVGCFGLMRLLGLRRRRRRCF